MMNKHEQQISTEETMMSLYNATGYLTRIRIIQNQIATQKIQPKMHPMTLTKAIYTALPSPRWNELIESTFLPGTEVPLKRCAKTNSFILSPKDGHTPEEKKRFEEWATLTPANIWNKLTHTEHQMVITYLIGYWSCLCDTHLIRMTVELSSQAKRPRNTIE